MSGDPVVSLWTSVVDTRQCRQLDMVSFIVTQGGLMLETAGRDKKGGGEGKYTLYVERGGGSTEIKRKLE